jgi:hypothetical protein
MFLLGKPLALRPGGTGIAENATAGTVWLRIRGFPLIFYKFIFLNGFPLLPAPTGFWTICPLRVSFITISEMGYKSTGIL